MSYYRKAKYAIHFYRAFTSNIKNPTPYLFRQTAEYFPSTSKPNTMNWHVVQHGKPDKPKKKTWHRYLTFQNVAIALVIGTGIVITVYYGHFEKIPYSKRTHFIVLTSNFEKTIGYRNLQKLLAPYHQHVLPATHPLCIRVGTVASNIVHALHRDTSQEDIWFKRGIGRKIVNALRRKEISSTGIENKLVQMNWRMPHSVKAARKHLEGLKLEFWVVDAPIDNACCIPGGKIVLFTGLLNKYRSDAQIATTIAHEVGHAVARHSAEELTKHMWLGISQLVLLFGGYTVEDLHGLNQMIHFLWRLPLSRRMEKEADYIGLLLMASAGYDPRVAPTVYRYMNGESNWVEEYTSSHPSGKRRARLLSRAKVMEEAISMYNRVTPARACHW